MSRFVLEYLPLEEMQARIDEGCTVLRNISHEEWIDSINEGRRGVVHQFNWHDAECPVSKYHASPLHCACEPHQLLFRDETRDPPPPPPPPQPPRGMLSILGASTPPPRDTAPASVAIHELHATLREYIKSKTRAGSKATDHDKARLIERMLDGLPIMNTNLGTGKACLQQVHRLAGILGYVLPDAGPDAIAALVRPSFSYSRAAPEVVEAGLAMFCKAYAKSVKAYRKQQAENRASWRRLADELMKEEP